MENYKRIAKDIKMHHLMMSLVYSVLAAVFVFGLMIVLKQYDQWLMGLEVTAVIVAAFCLIGFWMATVACAKIHHRIRVCAGTAPLESETFTACTKELSHGNEWLVYHRNNTYLFWTKKNIQNVKVLNEKPRSFTLAVYSTIHPEGESVTCTGKKDAMVELNNWLHPQM